MNRHCLLLDRPLETLDDINAGFGQSQTACIWSIRAIGRWQRSTDVPCFSRRLITRPLAHWLGKNQAYRRPDTSPQRLSQCFLDAVAARVLPEKNEWTRKIMAKPSTASIIHPPFPASVPGCWYCCWTAPTAAFETLRRRSTNRAGTSAEIRLRLRVSCVTKEENSWW